MEAPFPISSLTRWVLERKSDGIAVALSGGVDSALLLTLLAEIRNTAPYPLAAFTVSSPLHPDDELRAAQEQAAALHVPWYALKIDLLDIPAVSRNLPERCYRCKLAFFTCLQEEAAGKGLRVVADGTHASDNPAERPGMRALRELGISSPFAECAITKSQIRAEAHRRGILSAGKPAAPCLATRFPSGTLLTPESLSRVCRAEHLLRAALPSGTDFRIRVWDNVAVLEVPKALHPHISPHLSSWQRSLQQLGFRDLLLHPDGFRSGKLTPPPALKDFHDPL